MKDEHISHQAEIVRKEDIERILKMPLFDRKDGGPEWARWAETGLKKGLEEVQKGTTEEVDHGFLLKCLEAVLIGKNSEITHGKENDGAFADHCGHVLSEIAKANLGVVHSTQIMEKKYATRAAASARQH